MNFLIVPLLAAANCASPPCTSISNAPPLSLRSVAEVRRAPDPAKVLAFAGPTIPVAEVPSSLRWYEQTFKAYADSQWLAFGPKWDAGNSISGYERGMIYYVWWARTGNPAYLDRANQTVVNYRDKYLIPAQWAASPHWSQTESLYLHWLMNGDTQSRDAVLHIAGNFIAFDPPLDKMEGSWLENRVQTRVMMAWWMAEKIEGKGSTWSKYLDKDIPRVLKVQSPDGAWKFANTTCGGSLNYMSGMLADFLTRIYDQRPGPYNPAILASMTKLGNYLWDTQWRGAKDPSFNYFSVFCQGGGGPSSAPDLNGLIVPLFGWLGKTTGDKTWFEKGDQVFDGMRNASTYLYRQFSESYSSSFRYLGYRYGK
jgi:hypothetical protein